MGKPTTKVWEGWLSGVRGGGSVELLGMAAEFRSCEMRRVVQMDGGDGYETMGKQLIL